MHQSFGIRASCKHIHAMVNHAMLLFRNPRMTFGHKKITLHHGMLVLVLWFYSSLPQSIICFHLTAFGNLFNVCLHRLPFVGIVLIFQENIRKLVFVTICSQPVTHQSIHSMWPAVYFVNLKKEMDYARNAANFPIFLSLNLLIVGLNRTPLLLSSMKYSIADRHQYILV